MGIVHPPSNCTLLLSRSGFGCGTELTQVRKNAPETFRCTRVYSSSVHAKGFWRPQYKLGTAVFVSTDFIDRSKLGTACQSAVCYDGDTTAVPLFSLTIVFLPWGARSPTDVVIISLHAGECRMAEIYGKERRDYRCWLGGQLLFFIGDFSLLC